VKRPRNAKNKNAAEWEPNPHDERQKYEHKKQNRHRSEDDERMYGKDLSRKIAVAALGTLLGLASYMPAHADDKNTHPLANTQWMLVSYGPKSKPTDASKGLTLQFTTDGKIMGHAGCNTFGGEYGLTTAQPRLAISQLVYTEKYCTEEGIMTQETAYLDALAQAKSYAFTEDDPDAPLTIAYGNGQQMVFSRLADWMLVEWQLVAFESSTQQRKALPKVKTTLRFSADGNLGGSGGCNGYGGEFTMEDGTLKVGMLISTMMACEATIMRQEQDFMAALQAATTVLMEENRLLISDDQGNRLILEKVMPQASN
jgi:heat shock protein HslJ